MDFNKFTSSVNFHWYQAKDNSLWGGKTNLAWLGFSGHQEYIPKIPKFIPRSLLHYLDTLHSGKVSPEPEKITNLQVDAYCRIKNCFTQQVYYH